MYRRNLRSLPVFNFQKIESFFNLTTESFPSTYLFKHFRPNGLIKKVYKDIFAVLSLISVVWEIQAHPLTSYCLFYFLSMVRIMNKVMCFIEIWDCNLTIFFSFFLQLSLFVTVFLMATSSSQGSIWAQELKSSIIHFHVQKVTRIFILKYGKIA